MLAIEKSLVTDVNLDQQEFWTHMILQKHSDL